MAQNTIKACNKWINAKASVSEILWPKANWIQLKCKRNGIVMFNWYFSFRLNWLKRDSQFASKTCYGADPDRNYNIEWQKYESPSACSDHYEGPKAFSEPETKALAGFLDENKHNINVRKFFSFTPIFRLFACLFEHIPLEWWIYLLTEYTIHTSQKYAQTFACYLW